MTANDSIGSRRPRPSVAVVVATLDEERHVDACLNSIRAQTYDTDLMEVLVVDGGSTDGTRALVAAQAKRDPRVRLLDNPKRLQAAGYNRAIAATTADVVALVSAHSTLPPEYLDTCIGELELTGAENVGGRMIATGGTPFQKAVAAAMSSPAGIGGARHHYATRPCDVDSVWPGCFRREVFARVGLFREDLAVHEDYELNARIRAAGGRVRFSPSIGAEYVVRRTAGALARQYLRYGRAKAGVSRGNPRLLRPHHLVPPVVVMSLVVTAARALVDHRAWPPAAAAAGLYVAALVAGTGSAGHRQAWPVRARIPLALATMHLSWGSGMLVGIIFGAPRARTAGRPRGLHPWRSSPG